MRFEVKILQQDIPRLVDQLVQITGVEAWRKRFTWLEQESRENQHMREWLSERCGIEIALMEAVATGELKDPASYRLDLAGRYELAAFAAGVGAIHARLSAAGKHRLRGQIVDGLKTDKGLLPLQHEVSTAVHLVHSGFDVCFHDLESGSGFDFLAERDGLAVEVECKVFSGDLGRKIHKRALAKLFLKIRGRLMSVLSGLRTGLLVRITFPVRLSSSDAQHAAVSRALEESLLSADRCKSDECSVAVSEFSVASGPFSSAARGVVSPSDARQFVASMTGNRNPAMALLSSPAGQVLIVLFESSQPDDVIGGIRHQLREAAMKQFSRERPGVLAAQLVDLSNSQLLELANSASLDRATAPRLQVMTSDLLQDETRRHVHSVIYRGTPISVQDQTSVSSQGVSYFMRNEFHPLANDPRLAGFGNVAARR